MDKIIKIASLDPALANFGIACAQYNVTRDEFIKESVFLELVETEKDPKEYVAQDDMRRVSEIRNILLPLVKDACWVMTETPQTGGRAMQARSIWTSGIVFGMISSLGVEPVMVSSQDVKYAVLGRKNGTKQEMMDWGYGAYPDAPWKKHRSKGVMTPTAKNEHLADALAVMHAGIRKQEVKLALDAIRRMG